MNYDKVAAKIASQIKSYGESQIEHNIAAALRRAANEAAWRVWEECEKTVIELVEERGGSCDVNPGDYMQDYGPPARRRHAMSDPRSDEWKHPEGNGPVRTADIIPILGALCSSCIDEGDYDYAEDYIKDPFCRRVNAAAGQAIETIQEMRDLLEEACHSMDRCGLLSHADKIRAYLSK